MRTKNHFESEFQNGDFPCVIDTLDDGAAGISGAADVFEHTIADGFDVVMDEFLVHRAAFEAETVLEKREVPALLLEFFHQGIETRAGGVIKTFKLDFTIRLWAQDARLHRLNLTGTNSDFPDLIHGFAEKLEFKTGFSECLDPMIRLMENPGGFHGILNIVLAGHL